MKPQLIHCSYHKCLTVYYSAVMTRLLNRCMFLSRGYRHFNSLADEFYGNGRNFRVASINNHVLDLTRLGDYRISRFVRDPRDLVVSGYHYHKRGAEPWCHLIAPTDEQWKVVNGTIPAGMQQGDSYTSYLNRVSLEEGLIAEIEFRGRHFKSMGQWPADDSRILTFRYEDILNNEVPTFRRLFQFYGFSWLERTVGLALAKRFAVQQNSVKSSHIRDPEPSQWKKSFTPRVREYFDSRYGELLKRYNYAVE